MGSLWTAFAKHHKSALATVLHHGNECCWRGSWRADTESAEALKKTKKKKKNTVDFYICLASLLCKELRATFLCSHLGAEHIGCATALTDYRPKLWRPCLPAGGMPASNSCPLAFKMLSLLLTKTERKRASSPLLELFVILNGQWIFNDSLVWLD